MIPVTELQRALAFIEAPADSDERLGLVLNWLGGTGRSESSRRLLNKLGPSDKRPELMLAVHDWLDEQLFIGETLDEAAAGVGPERSQEQRRRRYRQLLGAFHPDRHPELGQRLTERLQLINQAYARFKRDPKGADAAKLATARPGSAQPAEPVRYEGIAPDRNTRIFSDWRRRWGQDRYLGHKLVLLMALLAMFPLVSMYLDDGHDRPRPAELAERMAAGPGDAAPQRRLPDGLNVRVDQWPPQIEPQPWREMAAAEPGQPDDELPAFVDFQQPKVPAWVASLRRHRTWLGGLGELVDRSNWQPGELPADPPRMPQAPVSDHGQPDQTSTASDSGSDSRPTAATEHAPVAPAVAAGEPPQRPSAAVVTPAEITAPKPAAASIKPPATETLDAETVTVLAPVVEPAPARSSGELQLGILASHDAGRVLTALQQSIEDGDLEGLLALLARSPIETRGRGRRWFEQHYGELFDLTTHRVLSLEVLSARRDGNTWRVEARYEFIKVTRDDAEERRQDGLVLYTLQDERGQMRIAAVDFQ